MTTHVAPAALAAVSPRECATVPCTSSSCSLWLCNGPRQHATATKMGPPYGHILLHWLGMPEMAWAIIYRWCALWSLCHAKPKQDGRSAPEVNVLQGWAQLKMVKRSLDEPQVTSRVKSSCQARAPLLPRQHMCVPINACSPASSKANAHMAASRYLQSNKTANHA